MALLLSVSGCRPGTGGSVTPPRATEALSQGGACHAPSGESRPLLVEWPAADRAQLEAAAHQGLVAVRYDGCQLQVLSRCELEGGYEYRSLNHKRDELKIRDRDALWAKLPLGAARLEAALSRDGQLNVDMMVVGQHEATATHARAKGNSAACTGATHVVTAMTVGAFSLYTGASVQGGAQAGVQTVAAGGEVSRTTEVLRRDGDIARCDDAPTSDGVPPAQCGALLRVELAPLGRDGALASHAATDHGAEVARLERAAERWTGVRHGARISAGVTATGTAGALVFVFVRTLQIDHARFEADSQATTSDPATSGEDPARDIQRYKDSRRTASIVAGGLAVSTAALIGLAAGARHRSNALERRARKLSVAPLGGPSMAGVSISGRF